MNFVELQISPRKYCFENSVALSSNDDKNLVFDCFNLDGFIGSNLLETQYYKLMK
jgi:hypothetical protein